METKVQLENARLSCTKFEGELAEKDEYFKSRELEIQDHYKSEFLKGKYPHSCGWIRVNKIILFSVENRFTELEQTSNARIASLEEELASKEKEYEEKLRNVTNNFKASIAEKDSELALAKKSKEEFLKRIKDLSSTENELREKVLASETEFGERLQLAALRERELNEKFDLLNKGLAEKLALAENEIMVLRSSTVSNKAVNASPKLVKDQPMTLENEIQSWRSVLEMKQKDISDLQRQNHDLANNAAALPAALAKISGLESRLEDLTIQLKIKNDEEQ